MFINNRTILFVYAGPFYPTLGGIERVTDTLAKRFIQNGYRVLYLALGGQESADAYDYPAPLFFFPKNNFKAPENITFYHQFLKDQKVDLVINQSGSFPESKLFLNVEDISVQTISVLHCNPAMGYKYLLEEYKGFLLTNKLIYFFLILSFPFLKLRMCLKLRRQYRLLSKNTDYICLLSGKFKEELLNIYPVNKDKIFSISNPNSFMTPQYPVKKKKQLLYVGRLVMSSKRPDRLLKIWEKIYQEFPEWELKFIGNGEHRKWMEKRIAQKKLPRITFEGYKLIEPYYQEASILCMTSNYEGFGMVLTEAMQHGTIPIAFDSYGAVEDIITPGKNGELVKPFDLEEYAEKLHELMKNDERLQKMSLTAFEDIKKFDEKVIGEQWLDVFKKIIP